MLDVNELHAGYGDIEIVHGISLKVPDKQIVAIVGANGAGKSTFIKALMGMIPVKKGCIMFEEEAITGLETHEISDHGITLIPEGRQLFPNMTVEENLDIGACTPKTMKNRAAKKEEMFDLLPRLRERAKQMAGTLSGGEQQMVATARALMSSPKLLVMDEPSWGLAPILVAELFQTIETVRNEGTAVLIVEQNVAKTLSIADWAYVFENGCVTMEGAGSELLCDEGLKKAFLGI
ncbi:MAG: ABC transporter ATP-binding protein [Clostridiales bacterium]|nr:ABC transporter ATP-binding protein [Clostridiales bacterium]